MGKAGSDWLDYDPCYLGLADTPAGRAARYQAFVREAIADEEWQLIRAALQRGQLTGGARFVDQVEQIIGRRVDHRGKAGRRGGVGP